MQISNNHFHSPMISVIGVVFTIALVFLGLDASFANKIPIQKTNVDDISRGYIQPIDKDYPGIEGRFYFSRNYPTSVPVINNDLRDLINLGSGNNLIRNGFAKKIIEYCFDGFDGNSDVGKDFNAGMNLKNKKWYHAMYMHTYYTKEKDLLEPEKGRDFIHGLTVERPCPPFSLGENQTEKAYTYAIAFYNDVAAYTVGQVWNPFLEKGSVPNDKNINFKPGSISFKLLFTSATVKQIPQLCNAPVWKVQYPPKNKKSNLDIQEVRLLQVDIAMKHSDGNWVFGTFHYDRKANGKTPWRKLTYVALTDTKSGKTSINEKSFIVAHRRALGGIKDLIPVNSRSREILKNINQYCSGDKSKIIDIYTDLNYQGYLSGKLGDGNNKIEPANGPVDNPKSSCISCHSSAKSPTGKLLDYSLQLDLGLFTWRKENYKKL